MIPGFPDTWTLGVFLDNAQDLVPRPPPTEKQLLKRWSIMVKDAHAVGLTSVHDAGFSPISLKFFERLASYVIPVSPARVLIRSQTSYEQQPTGMLSHWNVRCTMLMYDVSYASTECNILMNTAPIGAILQQR